MKNSTSKKNRDCHSTQPKVRYQRAERFQMLRDQMIPEDGSARLGVCEGLNLSALYARIKAV